MHVFYHTSHTAKYTCAHMHTTTQPVVVCAFNMIRLFLCPYTLGGFEAPASWKRNNLERGNRQTWNGTASSSDCRTEETINRQHPGRDNTHRQIHTPMTQKASWDPANTSIWLAENHLLLQAKLSHSGKVGSLSEMSVQLNLCGL